jgi:uncharacterized membrane protein
LGTTFLAFAIFFLVEKKWGKYTIFILLALMCKENFSIYVVFTGLYALLRKNWLPGILTLIGGLGWYFFTTGYLIPQLNNGVYLNQSFYQSLGPNLPLAIINIFLHPFKALSIFFTSDAKLNTLMAIFSSVLFLPFFAPSALLLAIPMLAERFFASESLLWQTYFHYSATISPALFFAAIMGIRRLSGNKSFKKMLISKKALIVTLALAIAASGFLVNVYLRTPLLLIFKEKTYKDLPEKQKLDEAVKLIPQDVAVSAQSSLGPRVAARNKIFLYPKGTEDSDFIFLDFNTELWPMQGPSELACNIEKHFQAPDWGLRYNQDSVIIFQRGYPKGQVEFSNETLNFIADNCPAERNSI